MKLSKQIVDLELDMPKQKIEIRKLERESDVHLKNPLFHSYDIKSLIGC